MTKEELLKVLKEIQEGKEGQKIPYNIIIHSLHPIIARGCLAAVIYLLENIKD